MFKKVQKNRAFFAAIAMILLSAIVMTTASFAWFVLGKSAQASNLDLLIQKQGEGLEISANTTVFTNEALAYEDLAGTSDTDYKAAEGYNYLPKEIKPSSSDFSISGKLPVFYAGSIDFANEEGRQIKVMQSTAATSANGVTINGADGATDGVKAGFYAFDVFIKYSPSEDGAEGKVKIGESSVIVKTKSAEDDADAKDGTEAATNAVRIGFVNCDTVTEGSTAQAAAGDAYEALIYANNEAARNTLPFTGEGKSNDLGSDITVGTANRGEITLAGEYACKLDTGANDETLTVKAGINRIRVYVWLEGQDANCDNELMKQLVTANLVFTLV